MKHFALVLLFLLACPGVVLAERLALVVGINEYPNFSGNQLEGCENDARAMKELLVSRCGFAEQNVTILLSGAATAAAIRQAVRERLIEVSRPGDLAVFYYSGHGSRVQDTSGAEPSGWHEIICPTDIKIEAGKPVNIIRDDELGELIGALAERKVVTIFDCCNSGASTRDILFSGRIRYLPLTEVRRLDPEEPLRSRGLMPNRGGAQTRALYNDMNKTGAVERTDPGDRSPRPATTHQ